MGPQVGKDLPEEVRTEWSLEEQREFKICEREFKVQEREGQGRKVWISEQQKRVGVRSYFSGLFGSIYSTSLLFLYGSVLLLN